MNVKALLIAAFAATLPFTAHAGGGDELSKAWLEPLQRQSTRSVAEVRAETKGLMLIGEQHPVELQKPIDTMRTRAEVKQELAVSGTVRIGA